MNNSKIYNVITASSKANFFVFALFLLSISVHAQDIITLRNGDEIRARVTEISASEIRYKRFDNLEGPTIVLPRADVFFINYENGTREIITPTSDAGGTTQPTTNVSQGHARQQQQVAQRREPTQQGSTRQQTTQRREPRQTVNTPHSKFYVGVSGGYGFRGYGFKGRAHFGPRTPTSFGLSSGAYFFNHRIGVGLGAYDTRASYEDFNFAILARTFFVGPVFYGHWGRHNGKFFFPTKIGIGINADIWRLQENYGDGREFYGDFRGRGLGIFCSAGVAYRPVKWFSVGLNLYVNSINVSGTSTFLYRYSYHDYYYDSLSASWNFFGFTPTLGINFHF
jgi:hypothetical protein